MKKSAIVVFLTITIAFATFVAGFYVGRNYDRGDVHIIGVPENTSTASTPTASLTPSDPTVPITTTATSALLININTATVEQLELLPGIGPKLAQAIVDYRTEYGNFETPEDLLHVSGIGEKKLAAILEYITTGG